jgi:hypothetical protein
MSDDLTPLRPEMPRTNPAQAREIARGLKFLSDQFAEAEMQSQANRALRESKWWLVAVTLESTAASGAARKVAMSDDDLGPLPQEGMPRATPAEARDTARAYEALADYLTEKGVSDGEAARLQRQSEWWLAYTVTLEGSKDDRA